MFGVTIIVAAMAYAPLNTADATRQGGAGVLTTPTLGAAAEPSSGEAPPPPDDGAPADAAANGTRVVFLHPENSGGTSFKKWVSDLSEYCEQGLAACPSPITVCTLGFKETWPAEASSCEAQVLGLLGAIEAPTLLVQAADGWPLSEPGFSARCAAVKGPLVVARTRGSHFAHIDDDSFPEVAAAVVPFVATGATGVGRD